MNREIEGIYTLWKRELIRFFRSKSRLIGSLGMPFFFWALLSVLTFLIGIYFLRVVFSLIQDYLASGEPEFWVLCSDSGAMMGFMGMAGSKIEALFLAPEFHRQGGGRCGSLSQGL